MNELSPLKDKKEASFKRRGAVFALAAIATVGVGIKIQHDTSVRNALPTCDVPINPDHSTVYAIEKQLKEAGDDQRGKASLVLEANNQGTYKLGFDHPATKLQESDEVRFAHVEIEACDAVGGFVGGGSKNNQQP